MVKELFGLVLAGGKSSRMGTDKAMINIQSDLTMLEHSFRLVSGVTASCMVSCAQGKTYPGYACVEDKKTESGPLAGIFSGLEVAAKKGFRDMLVLGCDLPLMEGRLLENLVAAHFSRPSLPLATMYESPENGKLEMLTAIYSTKCLPIFENALKENKNSLKRILPENEQCRIKYDKKDREKFINCNTIKDLQAAVEVIKKAGQ